MPENSVEPLIDLILELNFQESSDRTIPTENNYLSIDAHSSPETPYDSAEASLNTLSDRKKIEKNVRRSIDLIDYLERQNVAIKKESTTINLFNQNSRNFHQENIFLNDNNDRCQTTDNYAKNSPKMSGLEIEIAKLKSRQQENERLTKESVDSINTLIPLMVELLKVKTKLTPEEIIKIIVPVVDEIIKQQFAQDRNKMAFALADILPFAIQEEIKKDPEQIAKSIAPEIALAIQEQIRLDRDAISKALGPEMGKAIKTQIEVERDAMVDALYPVIGNTISKYMAEAIKSINDKVEHTLSPEGIKRKIRAKIQGVSEAELILRESIEYSVQAVFLIHKASGLVIKEIQSDTLEARLDSDMLAGMLTAVRSFVNEYIAQSQEFSELHEIEYGDSKILIEVAGYCYLAAIIKGEPSRELINKIRHTLGKIIMDHSVTIEKFDGDSSIVSESVESLLTVLMENKQKEKISPVPSALLLLMLGLFSAIAIPWGISSYRQTIANQIKSTVATELDAVPELSVYRIVPDVSQGKLVLTGRVPSDRLRQLAEEAIAKIAAKESLELNNQIIAVDVPTDPSIIEAEIQRVTSLLNQREGVTISTHYQPKTVIVQGISRNKHETERIIQGFSQIPGVDRVIIYTQDRLSAAETRIYFRSESDQIRSQDFNSKIALIAALLKANPYLNLKLIGEIDSQETKGLGGKRAMNVQKALVAAGIDPSRLYVAETIKTPPQNTPKHKLWLNRCVRFEVITETTFQSSK